MCAFHILVVCFNFVLLYIYQTIQIICLELLLILFRPLRLKFPASLILQQASQGWISYLLTSTMAKKVWTNEIDALFRTACEEFGEPSFRDIQDDVRFRELADFWLFDEAFFNLEVQRYKTEQAQLAAAEKLSADAATVKAKKKTLKKALRKIKKKGIWSTLLKNIKIGRKVEAAAEVVSTLEMKNHQLLQRILVEIERLNLGIEELARHLELEE